MTLTLNVALGIVRNPWGIPSDEVKRATLWLCDFAEIVGPFVASVAEAVIECPCTIKERDSGHRMGCVAPELIAMRDDAQRTLSRACKL